MDLLQNVVLLRCPDSDKEFTPVSPSTVHLCILYMDQENVERSRVLLEALVAT